MNVYNFDDLYYLLKNKKREYLTIKEEIDTIYFLVKKQKNQNFEDFCKIDLAADEVKKIKDNFFYCKRFLSDNEVEEFYLKKVEVDENEFLNFIENNIKNLNELNIVLREFEENEVYLIIADRFYKENTFEDTIQFPFSLF